ncbi:hypothetical protein KIN20_030560 [Parelaphostrongylus tenuis]|uniref:Uncharacterized protein n=1 Tax=Parelaphostrongylus tenuis TaxID=148309 RepID=A0AAD5WGE3_PARTN|nr:hypothetical protein KIN20_030560 [Parelaphostrongylus tenuis]
MSFCPFDNVTDTAESDVSSCCLDFATSTNGFYRASLAIHVVSGVLGVFLSVYYLCKYSSRHFLPRNTKVFLWMTLAAIITHSTTLTSMQALHLMRSFQAVESDPCSVQSTVSSCTVFRHSNSITLLILGFNQYFVYVDRLLDNMCSWYKSAQNLILSVLLISEVFLAVIISLFAYRNAIPTEPLLSCLNVPRSSTIDVTIATAVFLPINCLCIIMSILLFRRHRRNVTESRFDVLRHFHAKLNKDALCFLRSTTITMSVLIVLYPILITTVRLTFYYTPRILNKTLGNLAHIANWYCVIVPVVMIHAARKVRSERRRKIDSILQKQVHGEEGANTYFNLLNSQWQKSHESRSGQHEKSSVEEIV